MFVRKDDGVSSPLAIVCGGDSDGEVIFLKEDNSDSKRKTVIRKEPITEITLGKGTTFELLPSSKRWLTYVCGSNGCGKSVFSAMLIEKYLQSNPDAEFIVYSRLDRDAPIDALKPYRVQVTDELIERPPELEDIPDGSVVLFDDIDNISNKKLQHVINKFKEQLMECARKKGIQLVITSHLINGNDKGLTRIVMNEMSQLVIFPKGSGSFYGTNYVLKHYFGFSAKQIKLICDMDSRWVVLTKNYPQAILTQKYAIITSELGKEEKK